MDKKYYKEFDLSGIKDKDFLEKQELYNLFKKPKKDNYTNTPHFDNTYAPNVDHQADLLFMPEDNGYKYILVVTDIATRLSDVEPLQNKSAEHVKDAFNKIYKRNILKLPESITMDAGSEFKGPVKKWFEDNKVFVRYAKPGRSRQLAMVERTNQFLAKTLFMRMQAQEILTGQPSTEWTEDLADINELLNQKRERNPPPVKEDPVCSSQSCELLDVGTKVRVALDKPADYLTNKKLTGKFRVTDIRFNPIIRTIEDILILPNRPPLYILNDVNNPSKAEHGVSYTRNQLQIVPKDEQAPDTSVIRGKPTTYIIEKILNKKKIKNKWHLLIKYKAFKDPSWQPYNIIKQDAPLLVQKFEQQLKDKV